MRIARILAAFLAGCAPLVAGAQNLRVTVRDVAGKPVAFAAVWLLGDTAAAAPSAPLVQTATNASGETSFDRVPAEARRIWIGRIGYAPVTMPLGASGPPPDHLDVVLEDIGRVRAREDSIRAQRHRERVAIARSRPRQWICASGDSIAHSRARTAYRTFAGGDGQGMNKAASRYGMPDDPVAFTRVFVTPLSPAECVRFAEGLDRSTGGLESDTVEVYRFGKAYYLPWYGGYDGGFANADGRVLAVIIAPD